VQAELSGGAGGEDARARLLRYLPDKEMLIVLDNFEHLLDGIGLLPEIMRNAPGIHLLVTSREHLDLQAEWVLDIAGLPFPEEDAGSNLEPEALNSAYGAVALFIERAQSSWEDFAVTPVVMGAIARICRLVSGLPLAIELAASRVRDFSCEQIADEIEANLDFLTTTMRDVPPTHASMRAVFDYSWRLLPDEEKRAFRKLSIFRGGWDAEAASKVLETPTDTEQEAEGRLPAPVGMAKHELPPLGTPYSALLRSLADKSLLRRDASGEGVRATEGVRYDIHEVLRQYAAEQLARDPHEEEAVKRRHAEHYLAMAEAAEPHLRGPEQAYWLGRLESEHANLRAGIHYALETGRLDLGLRLGGALWQFWLMHAHYAIGRELLESLEAHAHTRERTPARAKALLGAGRLALQQADFAEAVRLMDMSLLIYRELGDESAVRTLLIERGNIHRRQGDYLEGKPYWEEALQLARTAGDRGVTANALTNLGSTALNQGDFPESRKLYEECLALQRAMEDQFGVAWTLTNLGTLTQYEGNSLAARPLFEESLAIRREIGDRWGIATCLSQLGGVACDLGEFELARQYVSEALVLRRDIGDRWAICESLVGDALLEYSEGNYPKAAERWREALNLAHRLDTRHVMAFCLAGLAAVAARTGDAVGAARLVGFVTALLASIGVQLSPMYMELLDEATSISREQLGVERWEANRDCGKNGSLEEVV
jgi:predicted ATPase